MTLLSLCTDVAQEIPVSAPSTIVDNTDATAILLLIEGQRAGEALARAPQGGWVNMIREYDFVTAAVGPVSGSINNTGPNGVAQITGMPANTTAGMAATTWYAFGTGVRNNSLIQTVNSGTEVTLNQAATQTGTGLFNFGKSDYPLPADFNRSLDNTMWDRSRFWSMRGPQSPQQWQLYKSSVIGRATIQRRYRFRYEAGAQVFSIDPVPTDNGSALVFEYVSTGWCQSATGTPQSRWLADTDTGVIDEYLMGLSLRWRMLRRLGMSYSDERDESEREISKAIATDGGAAILDLTPGNHLTLIGPWNLPETNFGNVSGS